MYFLKEFMKLYNVLTENIDSFQKILRKIQYLPSSTSKTMPKVRKYCILSWYAKNIQYGKAGYADYI